MNPRHKRFLEELPKNNYKVGPSAIKAGYSKSTANKKPKAILKTALKAQAQEIIDTIENKPSKELKQTMAELVGFSREEVMDNLKFLANQDKDLSTRLKVIAPLAKEYGVNLGSDEQKTIVPVLHIGVKQLESPMIDGNTPENGPTEPYIEG